MKEAISAWLLVLITSFCLVGGFFVYKKISSSGARKLSQPTDKITVVKEMLLKYDAQIPEVFNNLTPQERVFAYYMYRASLPGKRITVDQLHRNGLEVISIFKFIIDNEKLLLEAQKNKLTDLNVGDFFNQAKTYLVYLWLNYGQYFQREQGATKRVPARLGLNLLTEDNLIKIFTVVQQPEKLKLTQELASIIFDPNIEAVQTKPGSIAESAVNVYSHDFTDEDFKQLPKALQQKLNAYFYIDESLSGREVKSLPYSASGKYAEELSVSVSWLKRALGLVKKHPAQFDLHLVKSLGLLITFLETGDEKFFKEHSIEWLKSNSKIDYCFGFIETYDDPMGARGMFQAEVTVKNFDSKKVDAVLKKISSDLSCSPEFGGDTKTALEETHKNLSINVRVFGLGHLGPLKITAAYCLPNYDDIRVKYGSKQIVYPPTKSAAKILNPELYRKLFSLPEQLIWLEKHDKADDLNDEINLLQTVLHEVVGHGCGREKIENSAQLLAEYEHTIEELKAEIIALHTSTKYLNEFLNAGFFKKWAKFPEDDLKKQLVLRMASTYFGRMLQQSENVTEIVGDHARANTIIARYLVDKGVLTFNQINVEHGGKQFEVIGLEIVDLPKALKEIEALMKLVVTIRLSGDKAGAKTLITKYGIALDQAHLAVLKNNYQEVAGEVKVVGCLHPKFTPILKDSLQEPEDIKAAWPTDVFDLYDFEEKIEMSSD